MISRVSALRRCACGGVLNEELRCAACGQTARVWIVESNGRAFGAGASPGRGYPGGITIAARLEDELRGLATGPPLSHAHQVVELE